MSNCSSCGETLEVGGKFCGSCGRPVAAPETANSVKTESPQGIRGSFHDAQPLPHKPAPGTRNSQSKLLYGLVFVAIVLAAGWYFMTQQTNKGAVAGSAPTSATASAGIVQTTPTDTHLQPPEAAALPAETTPAIATDKSVSSLIEASIGRTHKAYVDAGILSVAPHWIMEPSCSGCAPFQIFCTTPISSISDIKGRKVRVNPRFGIDEVRSAGGIPSPLPFTEVRGAMQTGIIDCSMSGGTVPDK